MGNDYGSRERKRDEKFKEVEQLLYDSYRKLDIDFTLNQLVSLKLKLKDAEKYFYTQFHFLMFFNNSLFTDNVTQLYNNFNKKIENFSINNQTKIFKLLICLDDETESINNGEKIEFENLFTIIFERLEINIILHCDLTNCPIDYIIEFFTQLLDNATLYKSGRKFDCLYVLLPNIHYIIKNSQTLSYYGNNESVSLKEYNENFMKFINIEGFKKFLKAKYDSCSANNYYSKIIEKILPLKCLCVMYFNFNTEINEFVPENEYQFVCIENLIRVCNENIFYVYLNHDFKYNENFDLFINKILASFNSKLKNIKNDKNNNKEIRNLLLKIKIIHSHKENDFKLETLFKKVNDYFYDYFKNKKNYLNCEFIFEFNEIKGKNKKEKCSYKIINVKYKFLKYVRKQSMFFEDKKEQKSNFDKFQKIFKNDKRFQNFFNNEKILNIFKELLDKNIQNEEIKTDNNTIQIFIEKNSGIEFKSKFKNNFLNSI